MSTKKKLTCALGAESHCISFYSPCEARELDMVIKAKFGIDRNAQLELYDEEGDIVALSSSIPSGSHFSLSAYVPPSRGGRDSGSTSSSMPPSRYADMLQPAKLSRPPRTQIRVPRSYHALEPLTVNASRPLGLHSITDEVPRARSNPVPPISSHQSFTSDSQAEPTLSDFEDLLSVVRKLTSADSPKRAFHIISSELQRLTNAQFVEVFLVTPDGESLTRFMNNPLGEVVPASRGIVGHVARTTTLFRTPEAKSEKLFLAMVDTPPDADAETEIHAILAAPVVSVKGCVAVIQLVNKNANSSPFLSNDAWVMDQLARHAGLILESIHLKKSTEDMAGRYMQCARLLTMMPSRGVYVTEFLKKAMSTLQDSLAADRCSLLLVDEQTQELRAQDAVSGEEIRVPLGEGIAGHVVASGTLINAKNLDSDPRFNPTVDKQTGYVTKTLLCAPLKNSNGQIFGVVNALNKRVNCAVGPFDDNDEDLMKAYAVLLGTALDVCGDIVHESSQKRSSTFNLKVLSSISEELHTGGHDYLGYIAEVLRHLTAQVAVDSCALLLYCSTTNALCCKHPETDSELRIDLRSSVFSPLINKRLPLRVSARTTPIDSELELISGGRPEALLAYPIYNPVTSKLLGVLSLSRFTPNPISEDSAEILTPSASLVSTLLLKIVMPTSDSPFVDTLTLDHISDILNPEGKSNLNVTGSWSQEDSLVKPAYARYTMFDLQPNTKGPSAKASPTEELHFSALANVLNHAGTFAKTRMTVDRYVSMRTPLQEEFRTFECNVLKYPIDELICHVTDVFVQELNFPKKFNIALAQVVNYVGTVCNNYRDVPYHNVYHACDVLQASFAAIKQSKASQYLTDLDQFALLVSALCHDLDHPGVNNPYLVSSGHRLATLYNDQSVLESYHTAATFLLLENAECNVLATLGPTDYQDARSTIISNILATDMKNHFGYVRKLTDRNADPKPIIADSGAVELTDRRLIMECIIKCADLVHCVRPFACAKHWEDLVMEEFFQQGDKERELGLPIGPVNDRTKVDIPKSQIFFYKTFGRPLFSNVAQLLPGLLQTVHTLDSNLTRWEDISAKNSNKSQ